MYCAPIAMARAGFNDFRTNKYLGNKIFHVELPSAIIESTRKGGEEILKGSDARILAFDAMPFFKKNEVDEVAVKSAFTKLDEPFIGIQSVKSNPL